MRRVLSSVIGMAVAFPLYAQGLMPLDDSELSAINGQAFVSIDQQNSPIASDNAIFTRINLGLDIEIQTNMDVLELGRYEREGEREGSSDLLARNFGLGYIHNSDYFARYPEASRQRRPDGSNYANGDIVPFFIKDPYIEFARDRTTGEPIGVRIGFGGAEGILSGEIESLTGAVNIQIRDTGAGLKAAREAQRTGGGNAIDELILLLAPTLTSSNPLVLPVKLVYGPDDPRKGQLDPIRAQYVGAANGDELTINGANILVSGLVGLISPLMTSEVRVRNCGLFSGCDLIIVAQQCDILGLVACFDLKNYNSFPIGTLSSDRKYVTGPASGLFISAQSKDLSWLNDVKKANPTASDFIRTTSGAFFNIPNGTVAVGLQQALVTGIERYRGEYIERGVGLF